MNPDVVAILGPAFRYGTAIIVAKGWLPATVTDTLPDQLVTFIEAAYPFAMMAWGLWNSRLRPRLQAVLASHGVSTVHASPELVSEMKLPGVVPTPPGQP